KWLQWRIFSNYKECKKLENMNLLLKKKFKKWIS
ncbi:uncharacterized protein METZ01_LOCUS157808, partial [marine metagenome]